jgi:hypothetical protein
MNGIKTIKAQISIYSNYVHQPKYMPECHNLHNIIHNNNNTLLSILTKFYNKHI